MRVLQDLLANHTAKRIAENEDKEKGIMARSDDFTVEVDMDSEMVDVRDGNGHVQLTMSRDTWMDLCKQSLHAED